MGYTIEHIECADADHVAVGQTALGRAWAWLQARRAGQPIDPTRTCTITEPVDCTTE